MLTDDFKRHSNHSEFCTDVSQALFSFSWLTVNFCPTLKNWEELVTEGVLVFFFFPIFST